MKAFQILTFLMVLVNYTPASATKLDENAITALRTALRERIGTAFEKELFSNPNDIPYQIAHYFAEKAIFEDDDKRSQPSHSENGIQLEYVQPEKTLSSPSGLKVPVAYIFPKTRLSQKRNASSIIDRSSQQISEWIKANLAQIGVMSLETEPSEDDVNPEDVTWCQSVVVFFPVPGTLLTYSLLFYVFDDAIKKLTEKKAVRFAISENLFVASPTEFLAELSPEETRKPPADIPTVQEALKKIAECKGEDVFAAATYTPKLKWDEVQGIMPTGAYYYFVFWKENKPVRRTRHGAPPKRKSYDSNDSNAENETQKGIHRHSAPQRKHSSVTVEQSTRNK